MLETHKRLFFECQRRHKFSMPLVSLGLNEVYWKIVSEMKWDKDSKTIITSIRACSCYRSVFFYPMSSDLELWTLSTILLCTDLDSNYTHFSFMVLMFLIDYYQKYSNKVYILVNNFLAFGGFIIIGEESTWFFLVSIKIYVY